jgi:hypothetical protein
LLHLFAAFFKAIPHTAEKQPGVSDNLQRKDQAICRPGSGADHHDGEDHKAPERNGIDLSSIQI